VCEICNRSDVKIYAGCDKPMKRELVTAEYVHGQSGLDGIDIYEPEHPLEKTHAIDFIIETLMAADDNSITLIPTGPLTNIGTAIAKEPTILPKIKEPLPKNQLFCPKSKKLFLWAAQRKKEGMLHHLPSLIFMSIRKRRILFLSAAVPLWL